VEAPRHSLEGGLSLSWARASRLGRCPAIDTSALLRRERLRRVPVAAEAHRDEQPGMVQNSPAALCTVAGEEPGRPRHAHLAANCTSERSVCLDLNDPVGRRNGQVPLLVQWRRG
jgi:hypothetical protein